ncbi:hypothetical protein [Enterococcus durans]|uniref:hypothetical protein n=1 Tax=Enterococcus durans TaxID=53345 RepID=UPI001D0B4DE3|nr:hypothetical protein [Enterococcus durans]MCB8505411.1 hypothetical protein [Enterococcus durans]MCB8514819.1 hypothetical protein [Enterococcus durans]
MDIPDNLYPKELIATSKLISEIYRPSIDIVNAMRPAVEQANRLIAKQDALIASQVMINNPFKHIIEERNKSIANMIPPSVFAIQKELTLPLKIAGQITTNIPNFSKFTETYASSIANLSKHDFRFGVLEQEVTNGLSELLENSSETIDIDENDKPNDFTDDLINFDEKLLKSTIYAKDKSQQAQDITDIKDLLWKIYENQRDQVNQPFKETVQKKEQSSNPNNSSQIKILAFINGVLLTVSLITSPKEIYEFLIWINHIISVLLNK